MNPALYIDKKEYMELYQIKFCPKCNRKLCLDTTHKGYRFILSYEDRHLINMRWSQRKTNSGTYIQRQIGSGNNRKTLYLHREIMKPPDDKVVDHIDGDTTNNCRCNLRSVSAKENKANRHYSKTNTGIKFITKSKNRYRVLYKRTAISTKNLSEAIDWRNGLRGGQFTIEELRKLTKGRQSSKNKFNYKLSFIKNVINHYTKHNNLSLTARRFNIKRDTIYRWLREVV